jgi:cytochrome c oxidase subunit 2
LETCPTDAMGTMILLAAGSVPTYNLSIFDPASPPAAAIRHLSVLTLAIAVAILLLVEGILFYSVFRFRHGPLNGGSEPPQVYGSKPIEIAWTAAPALIVFILTLVILRTEWEVRADPGIPPAGSKPLYVTVIGRQWWWEYHYDRHEGRELNVVTANELHVPASTDGDVRPVYLTLQSADVCHSFWVPRLAGKTDLIPGRVNHMWFRADQQGLYVGQCAEYCGTQHANMLLRVYAEPAEEFARWLENEGKVAVEDAAASAGRDVFRTQTCGNCHAIRGTPARGTYAPDLTHLMSRQTLAAGTIPNTPENLRRWVQDPQQFKPGCLMAPFALSEKELEALVGYLQTLR